MNYSSKAPTPTKPFWDLTVPEISQWIHALTPGIPNTGGMLFPVAAKPPSAAGGATIPPNQEQFATKMALGELLVRNLMTALSSASTFGNGGVPEAKRQKIDHNTNNNNGGGGDKFKVLDPSFAQSNNKNSTTTAKSNNTSELSPGAILSRITLGGLVNGMSGVEGGCVDTLSCIPLSDLQKDHHQVDPTATATKGIDAVINTAGNLILKDLIKLARGLLRSISARTEMDVMATTPRRIADLLCPEVSDSELKAIRRRVYDTVILGQGTNASSNLAALEDESKEIPVSAQTSKSEVEQWKKCTLCGNNDQASFILDRKNGDLICTSCGTVVGESIMHEGQQFRKFEGEEDRNHHGDAPNPLFSNSHNMGTTLGGISMQTGAGIGGYGSGGRKNIENVLRNAHSYTEMNISQFGKEEKKTRIGYKDRQKKDAFMQMVHATDALGLHEAVLQRAKEFFAGFRDDRELVQQFKGVIAACLCEAFEELSKDGQHILKKRAGEDAELDVDEDGPKVIHARASRRNDLHSASLAGKGGLLLDKTVVSHGGVAGGALDESKVKAKTGLPFESKPAATWDFDDCKNWMIEASKSIAKHWSQQSSGATGTASTNNGSNPAMAIPTGTKDELEGTLVEHTLVLCEYLEAELKNKNAGKSKVGVGGRVHTPRVADMGTLGIKWQKSHERGSGGKGGVGNSGRTIMGHKPGERSGRTAGQILLLLTPKKFGSIIKDPVAGAAFHKELKAISGMEQAKKWKERRDEATKARRNQMNRKPWLQKRVEN
ncbi:hypothetical protein QTG54_008748 [Skeletonema marinoi]|uniref:General transcription factor TFIIB n=1 Tax=Skeletonema marinoi TaxID=267567 RepID=A0AAD9DCF7_9STRA|nr:hypothetical protein QTG54_008748 [Skeletonema marinoi]